eukprot:CAMPEP_0198143720 /NCGR_PEP_ID=MMETSP1443-20131203/9827_1 /TAXON_ID=186043 /ORGANISM="Entomoneis sp., Strain CCMP2396" /LENGTH=545 /DNA_ID=CAMNT_0043806999 /DNA_START=177 /DNA_END=1814 /DNA_ORIENTATION=+
MTEGASYGTLIRALCERVRGRAFISYKKWIFFGDEMWWVAHPAITAHVFSPVSSKNWFKVNKTQANDAFYMKESAEGKRTALLYTGDDQRWRTARYHLTPYFYNTDFTTLDDKVCAIVKKHIDRLVVEGGGHTELLEFLLLITIDLLCQVLYDSVLSQEDLGVLTHCMAEYIVPGTKYRGDYDGLDCLQYHTKVAVQMTKGAGAGTLAGIIRDCPDMTDKLKEENVAFFLEALTPAFASFWTISNILLITDEKLSDKAKTDATFRQQCIKESLRMYPPVPVLWPREAKCDHTMPNPIYAEGRPKAKRSFLSKMFGSVPFEEQPELKVKKGTKVFVIPTVYHYDDRFWFLPNEFRPERWNKDPGILGDFGENASSAKLNIRKRQSQHPGLLGNMKDTLGSARSMKTMQGKAKEFFADETLRSLIIGKETEEIQAAATYDQILESTDESAADLQKWTFLPFGLGQHTCMGRRLAVAMVDNTVKTFLKNDVMFYKGVVPSLFSRKIWHERVEAVAAVYNFPADPVFVQMKPSSKMKSVYSQSFYHGGK